MVASLFVCLGPHLSSGLDSLVKFYRAAAVVAALILFRNMMKSIGVSLACGKVSYVVKSRISISASVHSVCRFLFSLLLQSLLSPELFVILTLAQCPTPAQGLPPPVLM